MPEFNLGIPTFSSIVPILKIKISIFNPWKSSKDSVSSDSRFVPRLLRDMSRNVSNLWLAGDLKKELCGRMVNECAPNPLLWRAQRHVMKHETTTMLRRCHQTVICHLWPMQERKPLWRQHRRMWRTVQAQKRKYARFSQKQTSYFNLWSSGLPPVWVKKKLMMM